MTKEELRKYFIIDFRESDEKIIKIIGKSVLKEICFDPYILEEDKQKEIINSFEKEFKPNKYSDIEERYIRRLFHDVELGNVKLKEKDVQKEVDDIIKRVKSIS